MLFRSPFLPNLKSLATPGPEEVITDSSFQRAVANRMSSILTIIYGMQQMNLLSDPTKKHLHIVVPGANNWNELKSETNNIHRMKYIEQFLHPNLESLHISFIGPEVPTELVKGVVKASKRVTFHCKNTVYVFDSQASAESGPPPSLSNDATQAAFRPSDLRIFRKPGFAIG